MVYTNWTMQKSELNDEEYSQVADWCNENQTHTIEDMGEYYAVVKIPEIVYTNEQIEQFRAAAYQQEVDPITSHIQRLRDKEQTEEILAKIDQLIIERDKKVIEIQQKFPYNEQKSTIL